MMFSMFSSSRLWWKKNRYNNLSPSEPGSSTESNPKSPKELPGAEKSTGKRKDHAKNVYKWHFRRKNLVDPPPDSKINKEDTVAARPGVARGKLNKEANEFNESLNDRNTCRSKTTETDGEIDSTTLTVYPTTNSHLFTAGLPNFGKTCYCNASLQFLFTAETFCRELSNINDHSNDKPEGQFIRLLIQEQEEQSFYELRERVMDEPLVIETVDTADKSSPQAKKGEAGSQRFFVSLWKMRNNLEDQGDNSKVTYLLNLFNAISDANPIFKIRKGNSARKFIWQCLNQIKTTAKMLGWEQNADPRCPVRSNFIIKMKKVMKCNRCGFKEDQFELVHYITVPLLHKSLDLCISKALHFKFKEKCKKCEKETVRYFWTFHTLPRFLILHLKRLISNKDHERLKLDHPVVIKSQLNINVSAYSKNGRINRKCIYQSSPETPKPNKGNSKAEARKKSRKAVIGSTSTYRLISVLSHIGNLPQIGHFVTDCISPNPPQWVNYNDEDVTLTTEEDVLKERSTSASVFLYEKVSTDETLLLLSGGCRGKQE